MGDKLKKLKQEAGERHPTEYFQHRHEKKIIIITIAKKKVSKEIKKIKIAIVSSLIE